MTKKDKGRTPADQRLRSLLRRGDPAGDGVDLAPSDVARMRRMVAEAASARRWAIVPVLRWAGATAAVLAVVLIGRLVLQPGPPGENGTDLAVAPSPSAGSPATTGSVEAGATPAPSTRPEPGAGPGRGPEASPGVPTRVATADPPPVPEGPAAGGRVVVAKSRAGEGLPALETAVSARQPRQVQFRGPGGTRIIWTLDPNLQLGDVTSDGAGRGGTS